MGKWPLRFGAVAASAALTIAFAGTAPGRIQDRERARPGYVMAIPDDRTSRYREINPPGTTLVSTQCTWLTEQSARRLVTAWTASAGLSEPEAAALNQQLRRPDAYVFLVWVSPTDEVVLGPLMKRKSGPKLSVKGKVTRFKVPEGKPVPGMWAASRHFLVSFPRTDKTGAAVIADPSSPLAVEYVVGTRPVSVEFVPGEVQGGDDAL